MAVGKRVRYEIFRRDDFTCRYCGQAAPEVRITIDHVLPTTLGGSDDPTNLVTACVDCNAGKGSTSPSEKLVADVSAEAMRYAQLTKAAWAARVAQLSEIDDFIDEIGECIQFTKPRGWRSSIGHFYALAVPREVIDYAITKTDERLLDFTLNDPFRYMCGIVWNHCREVNAVVQESIDMDGCWHTEEDLTNMRIEAYEHGWADGWKAHAGRTTKLDLPSRLLHNAVEGSHQRVAEKWVDGRQALAACG